VSALHGIRAVCALPASTAGTVIDNFDDLTHTVILAFRYGVDP
jgi:hypothetical protein